MAAGKCGRDASGLSLEVSSEPRGASAEHIMCALQKSRHLHPQGPSTAAWGQGGPSTWHGGPNFLSSPSTLSWASCRILRPFIWKGRARCFKVRYRDSSWKGTKGL